MEEEVVRKRPNTFRASSPNSAKHGPTSRHRGRRDLNLAGLRQEKRVYIYGSGGARARNSWNDRPPLTPTVTSSLSREAEFPRTVYRR